MKRVYEIECPDDWGDLLVKGPSLYSILADHCTPPGKYQSDWTVRDITDQYRVEYILPQAHVEQIVSSIVKELKANSCKCPDDPKPVNEVAAKFNLPQAGFIAGTGTPVYWTDDFKTVTETPVGVAGEDLKPGDPRVFDPTTKVLRKAK